MWEFEEAVTAHGEAKRPSLCEWTGRDKKQCSKCLVHNVELCFFHVASEYTKNRAYPEVATFPGDTEWLRMVTVSWLKNWFSGWTGEGQVKQRCAEGIISSFLPPRSKLKMEDIKEVNKALKVLSYFVGILAYTCISLNTFKVPHS